MNNSQRDKQIRQWAMFLHFSLLASFVFPYGGLIAPVIIWQIKKDELPEINPHGKVVVNWIISTLIYGVVCFALAFIFIGLIVATSTSSYTGMLLFPNFGIIWILVLIFGTLNIIFPIIGGIKANNGEVWKYPLSLHILK
jgi:uncharacterized protein